ncbi:MAG: ATP-dependent Clp protease ATP-binding subunit [Patescibacteria group bacterium]
MTQAMITCRVCGGSGAVQGGFCPECFGVGAGAMTGGRFLFWGKWIDEGAIRADSIGAILNRVLNATLFLFGIFGIGWLLWNARLEPAEIFSRMFWATPNSAKLVFWISAFFDCFLVSRLVRESLSRQMIPRVSLHGKSEREIADWNDVKKISPKQKLDVSLVYSADAMRVVKEAYRLALRSGLGEVRPVHIFSAALSAGDIFEMCARLGLPMKEMKDQVEKITIAKGAGNGFAIFPEATRTLLIDGYARAALVGKKMVDTVSLTLVCIEADAALQELLFDKGVDMAKLRNVARWLDIRDEARRRYRMFSSAAGSRPKGDMNRAMTAMETRVLDRFSDDLTKMAGRGDIEMCVGREKEFEGILRIVEGERKSIVLVGERGVGKEALLGGLAWRMVEENVPPFLRDKRLVSLSVPKLISGVSPSEAAERLFACLRDAAMAGNVILAIPDIHQLAGLTAGEAGAVDLADMLASELGKRYFLLIGTCTPAEYREHMEGTSLGNVLERMAVEEPEDDEVIHMLESKMPSIEYRSKTYASYDALVRAVELSRKLMHDTALPEKAIDLIKETARYVYEKRGVRQVVSGEDVAVVVTEKTHVPVSAVTASEAEKLLHLEDVLKKRVVGQEEALKLVSSALRRSRAELRDMKRPIASFLFLGPTGVGKTETAKAVAEAYFGSEEHMVRLDMSEYQEKTSVARMIGESGKGGLLTEPIRKLPFSLLLLDEIEKAHPDILNLFLQVFDDGRITDGAGRVIDFTNAIIVATSNAGTAYIQERIQQQAPLEQIKRDLMERELRGIFRPEFLNRFDGIVVYRPLSQTDIVCVAAIMIGKIAKQLEAKGIFLRATEEAIAELAAAGFDPAFGARPLRRVIQERVQDMLAQFLLTNKLGRRDRVVLEAGGAMRVEKAKKM